VGERVVEGLRAAAGAVPGPAGSGLLVVVRIARDRVVLSVDSSGEPLHRRGWRLATAKAPLPSTVAAAALLTARYDGSAPLLDPFCGSGTIPIEAALLADGSPPHRGRSWALQAWPSFAPGTWASALGGAQAAAASRREERLLAGAPPILGSDRDEGAVASARANAGRAGVAELVALHAAPVSAAAPPDPVVGGDGARGGAPAGWLVTNPPWGGRLAGGGDLRDLHAAFGRVVRERFAGWRVAVLTGDARLAGHAGLGLDRAWRTTVGGRPVTLLLGDVPPYP
jgi:putative N6-adenine-specific DNA methylase